MSEVWSKFRLTYHRDIRQSAKKKDRYADAEHYRSQHGEYSCQATGQDRTHRIARKTSVTLNRFSTPHSSTPKIAPSPSSNSPRNVNAHRRPHQAAGTVLRARHICRGTCQCALIPSRIAARGCIALWHSVWCSASSPVMVVED